MRLHRLLSAATLLACATVAQQPNSGFASMTIGGIDGPPYPIAMNARTSTTVSFVMSGSTNALCVICSSANGNVQPNSATFFGDKCDLPLSPPLVVNLSGLTNPAFTTDLSGVFAFSVNVPPAGAQPNGIPLGFTAAYQGAMVDFFSPFAWSLTAATRVTIVQGPTIVNMTTGIGTYGDSGQATVNLTTYAMTLPFYGVNHSTVHVSGDGYMTFGGGQAPDFTATNTEMNQGPPRIAGYWTDLDQLGSAIVRYTIDSNPGAGQFPYLLAEFLNVADAGNGMNHNFSWKIDTQGFVQIFQHTNQNPSIYDVLVGIGGGLAAMYTPPTNKDLSALVAASYPGAFHESFYEWFGIPGLNPNYTLPNPDPFDLGGVTLNFNPNSPGSLPASTASYLLFP